MYRRRSISRPRFCRFVVDRVSSLFLRPLRNWYTSFTNFPSTRLFDDKSGRNYQDNCEPLSFHALVSFSCSYPLPHPRSRSHCHCCRCCRFLILILVLVFVFILILILILNLIFIFASFLFLFSIILNVSKHSRGKLTIAIFSNRSLWTLVSSVSSWAFLWKRIQSNFFKRLLRITFEFNFMCLKIRSECYRCRLESNVIVIDVVFHIQFSIRRGRMLES